MTLLGFRSPYIHPWISSRLVRLSGGQGYHMTDNIMSKILHALCVGHSKLIIFRGRVEIANVGAPLVDRFMSYGLCTWGGLLSRREKRTARKAE